LGSAPHTKTPKPQSPIPNPQSPIEFINLHLIKIIFKLLKYGYI